MRICFVLERAQILPTEIIKDVLAYLCIRMIVDAKETLYLVQISQIFHLINAPWYVWDITEKELIKIKLHLASIEIINWIIFIFAVTVCIPVNNLKIFYILTTLSFCAAVLETAGLLNFVLSKKKITKTQFQNISYALNVFPPIRSGLLCLTAVGMLVLIILEGWATQLLLTALGHFICAVSAYVINRIFRHIKFYTEENRALKELNAGFIP